MDTIGLRIKYLREKYHVTQEDIAKGANVQRGNISHYEKDKYKPNYETTKRIAAFFDVDPDWLYYGDDDKFKDGKKKFLGSNLSLLRGKMSFEKYAEYLKNKGDEIPTFKAGVYIDPKLLERYEKGKELPHDMVINYIATVEDIDKDWFYQVNNEITLQLAKGNLFINNDDLDFMPKEIREWVKNPDNFRYIKFIYDSFTNGMRLDEKEP